MGKIFGLSDLPVSTIHSALEGTHFKPLEAPVAYVKKNYNNADKFVSTQKVPKSNAFVKMRNGIGKLLSHFSKSKNNSKTV